MYGRLVGSLVARTSFNQTVHGSMPASAEYFYLYFFSLFSTSLSKGILLLYCHDKSTNISTLTKYFEHRNMQ